ncbi:hypothetical protein MAPG_10365 [Magnaporthiopsis poae ATCC 64411]|uniref:Uncharacterized protein n=1 Tax=Magnaporthiopsis poae (strain ATCC 64411 / 73-15) TaxID=644358 RepID=A0A0C4ECE4_MAGP6|nr:hypothetical protein MAPG_10365 [Magnaporthiopsis poae ATCC 64411]
MDHTDRGKPELGQQSLGKHNVPSALCADRQPQRARPEPPILDLGNLPALLLVHCYSLVTLT